MEEDINPNISKALNLEFMPTIEKIKLLQKLLKELSFRKKAFKDTKEKMFIEVNKNCYKYFEGRINVKKAFDQILNQDTKIYNNKYILVKDSQESLKDLYEPLYNFYFLLQNDNSLMMKLIELCQNEKRYIEELSDFFVHFLYIDMIDSSFNEERLLLIIYLILEKEILKSSSDKYLTNSFLVNIFQSLTRKFDSWNFLGTIITKNILKIENLRTSLTIDIKKLNRTLSIKGSYLYRSLYSTINPFNKNNNKQAKKNIFEKNIQTRFNKYIKDEAKSKLLLKRAKKIIIIYEKDNNNEIIEKKSSDNIMDEFEYINEKGEIEDITRQAMVFKKRKTNEINEQKKENKDKINFLKLDNLNIKEKQKSSEEDKVLFKSLDVTKTKSESILENQISINTDVKKTITIDNFFQENSITKEKISEILDTYNNKNNYINLAMSEYLNNLLTILEIEKNNKLDIIKGYNENLNKNKEEEVFSSSYIIDDLILRGETQSKGHFNNLMKKKTLSNNLDNFPYSVKCILKMIDVLLNEKSNNNNHLKNYLFKLNFLIGNLIMPILKNPNYNGIISNIVSDITKKNLEIIYDIFEKMLEGSLFKRNEDDSMVLYNKFIIESLPKLFEIIDDLGKE